MATTGQYEEQTILVRNDKAVHLEKKNLIFDNKQNPHIKITLRKADQST